MEYVIIGILIAVILNAVLIYNLKTMQYKQLESIRQFLKNRIEYSQEYEILEKLKEISSNTDRYK